MSNNGFVTASGASSCGQSEYPGGIAWLFIPCKSGHPERRGPFIFQGSPENGLCSFGAVGAPSWRRSLPLGWIPQKPGAPSMRRSLSHGWDDEPPTPAGCPIHAASFAAWVGYHKSQPVILTVGGVPGDRSSSLGWLGVFQPEGLGPRQTIFACWGWKAKDPLLLFAECPIHAPGAPGSKKYWSLLQLSSAR